MRLFLNGGGSGNQTILAYQEINKIINHNKPVLYVPLAMNEDIYSYDECYKWIRDEIKSIDIPDIEMVKSFDDLSKKEFNNYSLIYIGGGNTYKLLKGLKETKCFDKLIDYITINGIVYGSSAGSVIFGKNIDSIKPMDENKDNLDDTTGFNYLNNMSIFVHYINYKSKYTEEENEKLIKKYTNYLIKYTKKNEKTIAIPEEDTIFYDGKNIRVIGELPYYIFENGNREIINND